MNWINVMVVLMFTGVNISGIFLILDYFNLTSFLMFNLISIILFGGIALEIENKKKEKDSQSSGGTN